jgi:NPCBM/NEW2 domain
MGRCSNLICRDRHADSSGNRCRVFPIMATVFTAISIISACGGGSTSSSAGSVGNPAATAGASGSFGSASAGSESPSAPGSGSPSAPGSGSPSASSPAPSSPGTSYYLADFNPVQTYGINVDSTPHTVNGVTYDHPVAWSPGFSGNPYWAEWDLSRQCTWLTSPGVGLADDAPSGATALFYVQTDGSYKWQKTIRLGQSDSLKLSIKGALRLRLTVTDVQDSVGNSYATWGDAQILCSSQPPNSTNGNS